MGIDSKISRKDVGVTEEIILQNVPDHDFFNFEMARLGKQYDAIVVNLDTDISLKQWENFGKPKILSPTTNISYIPNELHDHVIKLDPDKIPRITATAEHTFMLYLMACRNMNESIFSHRKEWTGIQVSNKNAAIFGAGRIGTLIKKYCTAFEMDVETYDKGDDSLKKSKLLSWADVVFVCLTYDESTESFFDIEDLENCKHGQIFVNTARPKIISRELISSALEKGTWSNFCSDFLNHEDDRSYVDKDLEGYVNSGRVFLTPHIAGNTVDSFSMALENVIENYEGAH